MNCSFSFSQGCHRTRQHTVWLWWLWSHGHFSHLASESTRRLWGLSHLMSLNGYQRLSDIQKVKKLNIYFPSILLSWAQTCDLGFSLQRQPQKTLLGELVRKYGERVTFPSLNCPFLIRLVLSYDLGYNS